MDKKLSKTKKIMQVAADNYQYLAMDVLRSFTPFNPMKGRSGLKVKS